MTKAGRDIPKSGLVLVGASLEPLAWDSGAQAIMTSGTSRDACRQCPVLPDELLKAIDRRPPNVPFHLDTQLYIGRSRYRCRGYDLKSDDPVAVPNMVAFYFEELSEIADPIGALTAEYRLTGREAETLRAIALGLSTKEVADRMGISPNTAKAFVRLVMIKLGVSSRAAIAAKLLGRLLARDSNRPIGSTASPETDESVSDDPKVLRTSAYRGGNGSNWR